MLPLLPTPHRRRTALVARVLAPLLSLVLLLGACDRVGQPPRGVLLDALSLQIQLTQGAIARALDLEATGLPEVSRVRVERQEDVSIGDSRGLHLAGRFDWRLPGDAIRVDSPFELYLQRGDKGQSWRLARPSGSRDGTRQDWITDPLPLPGLPGGAG
ncbi:MAG: hypothetical protein ER33_01265 [Cyanobium sp. CACIAM 14]|nr:MAG: hypothetical protein ER33_01265 [Cyanobium sp. CACIAM 14]